VLLMDRHTEEVKAQHGMMVRFLARRGDRRAGK